MEDDIKAVLAGNPLPPPTPKLIKAWRDAYVEAERSEYAFKKVGNPPTLPSIHPSTHLPYPSNPPTLPSIHPPTQPPTQPPTHPPTQTYRA